MSPRDRQHSQESPRPWAVRHRSQDLGRGRALGLKLADEEEVEGPPAEASVRGRVRGREGRTGGWVAAGIGRTEEAEGPARAQG